MRTATEDLFVAEAPTPYGPFTMRALAVPHAGRGSIVRLDDERPAAHYNPKCDDGFAMFCEQVGLVPLERAPDGDRESVGEGKGGSVRGDLGGRRNIQKKK